MDPTQRGLSGLDERERLVLKRFYVSSERGNVDRRCGELRYETKQVYRIKDDALYKYTICEYGLPDY